MRTGEDGEDVCAMRLAVPRVARGGGREPGVVYVEVTTSGWQAREIHEALAVGARVGVAGRIALEEWVDPGGQRRSRYEVMADQLELLDPPPGGAAPGLAA
ncbi:MAG: Single-strand binding protein family [Thermoleophilaceae bacterium]|jgi:single-stranded DNA-binding protein|nr:Single-strand binding protein family [Thermoleophilaceae bacterium]